MLIAYFNTYIPKKETRIIASLQVNLLDKIGFSNQ